MESVQYFSVMPFSQAQKSSNLPLPRCGISLLSAGSLKPKENTHNRKDFFSSLGINPDLVVSVAQTHSKIVHIVNDVIELSSVPEGDGVLTKNPLLIPCITVADCMPVYLFNPVVGCFGVLHSGWKGTGIIENAFQAAKNEWDAKPSDFYVLFGPHIHSCCYTVDLERAEYFIRGFGDNSVTTDSLRMKDGSRWPFRLSLMHANTNLCHSLGIPDSQVHDTGFCTACNESFGSSRRQGAGKFTQMAAFIHFPS